MTVDPSVAGRSYPTTAPYEVGRAKIKEFATAIGDDHAAYVDPVAAQALGHPDVIAPPTFATVVTVDSWRVIMADLGVDFANILHVDQRFAMQRPLRAGDVISTRTVIDEVRERMGASWLVLRTDLSTTAGEQLGSATATIMVRGDTDD